MSGRSRTGSRFEVLEEVGDDDDSGSVYEMRLSKDNYPAALPIGSGSSSGSSIAEMQLSRDFYPTAVDTQGNTSALPDTASTGYISFPRLPRSSDPGRTSSEQRYIKSRSTKGQPLFGEVTAKDESDFDFHWDHYKRDYSFDEVGVDALQFMFEAGEEPPKDVSTSIAQDILILRDTGFNIEYPDGLLGEGFYGAVYRGYFGQPVTDLSQVDLSLMFAVKILDYGDSDTRQRREHFETEKYILTNVYHKNIVTIRMIINMGEQMAVPFRDNPQETYLSPERVYMIMDYSTEGELLHWLNRNYKTLEPSVRITLIRDLFFGMLYLHSQNIVHGDVHAGNALLFIEMHSEIVAKWCDFGLGYVGSNKQFRYRTAKQQHMLPKFRYDVAGMYGVFCDILKNRHITRPETSEEKTLLDEFWQMTKMMKSEMIETLHPIHQRFRHILEDEFVLIEQHYY